MFAIPATNQRALAWKGLLGAVGLVGLPLLKSEPAPPVPPTFESARILEESGLTWNTPEGLVKELPPPPPGRLAGAQ